MAESAAAIELDGQYRALREEAGLLERARSAGCSRSAGAEAAEYLQGQLTNDVEALEPGEGCYAALLDRKGHMQADMRVLRTRAGLPARDRGGRRRRGPAAPRRSTRSAATSRSRIAPRRSR